MSHLKRSRKSKPTMNLTNDKDATDKIEGQPEVEGSVHEDEFKKFGNNQETPDKKTRNTD